MICFLDYGRIILFVMILYNGCFGIMCGGCSGVLLGWWFIFCVGGLIVFGVLLFEWIKCFLCGIFCFLKLIWLFGRWLFKWFSLGDGGCWCWCWCWFWCFSLCLLLIFFLMIFFFSFLIGVLNVVILWESCDWCFCYKC